MRVIRCAPAIIALMVAQALSLAADSRTAPQSGLGPQAIEMFRNARRAPLTEAVVAGLSLPVTREMQLRTLRRDPDTNARLALPRVVGPGPVGAQQAWSDGIVITPLQPAWPADATTWQQAKVAMYSRNIALDPWSEPLPTAEQNPPIVYMYAFGGESDDFLMLSVRFPAPGGYLVTVSAHSVLPTPARPRFGPQSSQTKATMVPNDPADPTQWTMLYDVAAGQTDAALGVYPSTPYALGGFLAMALTKITLRRL